MSGSAQSYTRRLRRASVNRRSLESMTDRDRDLVIRDTIRMLVGAGGEARVVALARYGVVPEPGGEHVRRLERVIASMVEAGEVVRYADAEGVERVRRVYG